MKYRVGIKMSAKGWEVFTERRILEGNAWRWIRVGDSAFFKLRESAEFHRKRMIVNYQKIHTN